MKGLHAAKMIKISLRTTPSDISNNHVMIRVVFLFTLELRYRKAGIGKNVINSQGGARMYLKDIADVKETFLEKESFSSSKGKNVITLNVIKRGGENLINASDEIHKIIEELKKDTKGFIFTNLVDFDSLYGHPRDVVGYKNALEEFDARIPEILEALKLSFRFKQNFNLNFLLRYSEI